MTFLAVLCWLYRRHKAKAFLLIYWRNWNNTLINLAATNFLFLGSYILCHQRLLSLDSNIFNLHILFLWLIDLNFLTFSLQSFRRPLQAHSHIAHTSTLTLFFSNFLQLKIQFLLLTRRLIKKSIQVTFSLNLNLNRLLSLCFWSGDSWRLFDVVLEEFGLRGAVLLLDV